MACRLRPNQKIERNELPDRFGGLYARVSKEALTRYYLAKLAMTEEAL